MKAVLQFNLPDDQTEFDMASQTIELREALETFQTWLGAMKDGHHRKLDKKSLQAVEAEFRGILSDFGIFLKE